MKRVISKCILTVLLVGQNDIADIQSRALPYFSFARFTDFGNKSLMNFRIFCKNNLLFHKTSVHLQSQI